MKNEQKCQQFLYRCKTLITDVSAAGEAECQQLVMANQCETARAKNCFRFQSVGLITGSSCSAFSLPAITEAECQKLLQTSCNCEGPRTQECIKTFSNSVPGCLYCSDKYCAYLGEGNECRCNEGTTRGKCVKEGNQLKCNC